MTLQFEHVAPRQRVLFGNGNAAADLAVEAARFQARNAMVISSRRNSAMAEAITDGIKVALRHHEVVEHVPATAADAACAAAGSHNTDLLVAVGGGSAVGLAKAIALTTGLPIIAVPIGYAGSKATNVGGITDGSSGKTQKTTGRPRIPRRANTRSRESHNAPRAAVESPQHRRCGPGTAAELRLEGKDLMIFLAHHLGLLFHVTHKQDLALWEAELAAPTVTLTSSAWVGWHEVDPVD